MTIDRGVGMKNAKHENIEKSYSKDRHVLGEQIPLKTPYTVLIDISDMCNLRCKYCFRGDLSIETEYYRKNRLMNWETFEKAVMQLKEFPDQIRRIGLSAHGEPLCNRRLPEMVRYIKEQGLTGRTEIHTNAVLLDEEYVRELCESHIDRVVVSIQGLDGDTYEKTCGVKVDFQRLVDMLTLFYQSKTNTQIHIKIVDVAVGGQEDKFYDIFSPIADRVFVEKVVPLWTGMEITSQEKNARNKYGDNFAIQKCCPIAFYSINILSDGTIFPCTNLTPAYVLGNIHEISLLDAWTSQKRTAFLREMLEQTRFANPTCKTCYVPQNTVKTAMDSIDDYCEEILDRL